MTASFEIKRAAPSDAAALAAFAARLFRDTYSDDTAAADLDDYVAKSFSAELQAAEIGDPEAAVFMATDGGVLAGYAYVVFSPEEADLALLSRIYVDANWRGRGVANHLLNAAIAECAAHNVGRLRLTVYEKNARAIAFYSKVGFAVMGTTTFTVGDDVQADLVMELDVMARRADH
ncbi:GNAT family N-acetyltransferase [Rhizobium sp. S152]|uniref:GNAT family N-acetyltransferase n=1 Tax=Rhizobium sp. S152 TaxID=3055038 RepID=UPI0025A9C173|nr:GNAT family N-acetyltransferase [Rhizobium sp. S152]MDM9626727.1 GNAT family N-acetyltransferase [Rhizobium sp. S152]